jgi:4-amino-4-deoxy-L-arabinose transferase-like glycosyltransferase
MASWRERIAHSERMWVLALLLLALALRVGYILTQQRGFYFEDSLDYDRAARVFLETGHFDPRYYRFPLYPLFMAASYKLFGPGLTPLRLLQAMIGVGSCALVWAIARRLFGVATGLFSLAALAVFPVHIVLSGIEYPVVPGTAMIWLVLWALVERSARGSESLPLLALAGIGAGVASLLFEGGLVLGIFVILCVIFQSAPWRTRMRDLALLGAAGSLLIVPWTYKMIRTGDYRPVILKAGIHLPSAPGVNPPLWEGSGENLLVSKLSGLAANPEWTARHFAREFVHFWDPYPDRLHAASEGFRKELHRRDSRMVLQNSLVGELARTLYAFAYGALMVLAAAGLIAAGRMPGLGILVAWPVLLGICYSPFFTQMRYRIPADPTFIILGAYAVEMTMEKTLLQRIISFFKALWEGWKKIAEKIMIFWTFVLLLLLFVIVVGPIALLMKILKKNPMEGRMAPGSFWALRDRTREGMEECLRQF